MEKLRLDSPTVAPGLVPQDLTLANLAGLAMDLVAKWRRLAGLRMAELPLQVQEASCEGDSLSRLQVFAAPRQFGEGGRPGARGVANALVGGTSARLRLCLGGVCLMLAACSEEQAASGPLQVEDGAVLLDAESDLNAVETVDGADGTGLGAGDIDCSLPVSYVTLDVLSKPALFNFPQSVTWSATGELVDLSEGVPAFCRRFVAFLHLPNSKDKSNIDIVFCPKSAGSWLHWVPQAGYDAFSKENYEDEKAPIDQGPVGIFSFLTFLSHPQVALMVTTASDLSLASLQINETCNTATISAEALAGIDGPESFFFPVSWNVDVRLSFSITVPYDAPKK